MQKPRRMNWEEIQAVINVPTMQSVDLTRVWMDMVSAGWKNIPRRKLYRGYVNMRRKKNRRD